MARYPGMRLFWSLLCIAGAMCCPTGVRSEQGLLERSGSLAALYEPAQAKALAETLPVDKIVRWRVYAPGGQAPAGVLVYVSPESSGRPRPGWIEVLERRRLIWVAADDFGNAVPTAERMLAAVMGLTLVQREFAVDMKRIYIAGTSGGGRVASRLVTEAPGMFTGAIYIIGADAWTSDDKPDVEHIRTNRYVFLTGHGDFNRDEMKSAYRQYRRAGIEQVLLMDLPGLYRYRCVRAPADRGARDNNPLA